MALQTRRRSKARQLADYHKDLVDWAIGPIRTQIEESGRFDDLQTRIALAGLDVAAINLIHLSLNDPIKSDMGRLVPSCQLDSESASAGLLLLSWYKLVSLRDDNGPVFEAEEFCEVTVADKKSPGLIEMETAWEQTMSHSAQPMLAPPLDFVTLRLYKIWVQRLTVGPRFPEDVIFSQLMMAMDRTIGDYFLAMVNDRQMNDVRAETMVYEQFLMYKGIEQ
jgi:hypothetical protein